MNQFVKLLKDESGATAIEYALIAALISIAAIIAMRFLGTEITETFNFIGNELNNANNAGS